MKESFIGEDLKPVASTFDTSRMAVGEPGLPGEFVWQGDVVKIAAVLRTWRETGPCRHGSGERYVRKHWYEVQDATGRIFKLYFERTARRRARGGRWQLFSVRE